MAKYTRCTKDTSKVKIDVEFDAISAVSAECVAVVHVTLLKVPGCRWPANLPPLSRAQRKDAPAPLAECVPSACTLRPPLPADRRLLDGSNVGTPYVQWRPRIVNCRLRPSGRSACFLWGGGFLHVCRFEGAPLASLIGRPALLPCSTTAAFLTARRSYCTLHFLLLCIRLMFVHHCPL